MKKLNKKILLGTTALFASALIATVAEAKPKLDIGGYVRFQAGFFDDKFAETNNRDFQTESQIAFKAKGVAQNGLEYGAEVYMNASTDDGKDGIFNSDVVFIWMENRCGRLELGDRDGAADKTAYYTKRIGFGQAVDGDYEDWLNVNSRSSVGPKAMDSAESTKITVYMPRMYGFQAGLSYAPEFNKGEGVIRTKTHATAVTAGARDYVSPNDASVVNGLAGNINKQENYLKGNFKDIIELGANYLTRFDDVEVRLSGAYVWGEDKNASAALAGERRDIRAWHVGGQLEWMGWTLGGGYVDNGKSAQNKAANLRKADRNAWNVGLAYENGPWAVSANALFEDLGGSSKDGKYTSYGIGGQYYLAPGIKVAADLVMFERKFNRNNIPTGNTEPTLNLTGGNNKDKGYVGIIGTQLDF
jgi:outer membrane protein OmpU